MIKQTINQLIDIKSMYQIHLMLDFLNIIRANGIAEGRYMIYELCIKLIRSNRRLDMLICEEKLRRIHRHTNLAWRCIVLAHPKFK